MTTSPGAVLITGASTGIGAATAHHLASLGFRVLAGVRRTADGETLAAGLPAASPGSVEPVVVDVTDDDSVAAAGRHVDELVGADGLAGLVNNAGVAVAGPVELVSLADWRHQLDVNVVGQVAVTQAVLPVLRRHRHQGGRVVFMSSLSGVFSPPYFAPYAASKHAVEAIADSLRRELRPTGMRVSIVQPGAVATPIWAKGLDEVEQLRDQLGARGEALYPGMLDALLAEVRRNQRVAVPAQQVADAVAHALTARRPRQRYAVGRDARMVIRLDRFVPGAVLDRLVAGREVH